MREAKEKKEISGCLHLDPRSKLLILVLFSVVVMRCAVYGFIHSRDLASDLCTAAFRRRSGDAYPFPLLYGYTVRPDNDYCMVLHINYKDQ